ncbi:tetratricopeptide repeat protein [Aestuariivirga sp.]|uniref:tetratricopeptide repeat protein n=1 Tax=Aestuariivirga sp. TaxID=2650926 RepID=UPI0039E64976
MLLSPRHRHFAAALMMMASSLSLVACQRSGSGADPMATGSTSAAPASFKQTAKLGETWKADPTNAGKGIAYANGLEALGQTDQQLQVLQQISQSNPNDTKVASYYGKKLVQAGQASDALPILEAAAAAPDADYRVHSALGSAYDQQQLFDKAQAEYQKALALKPNDLSVLNNMAMSYAVQGDLKRAEATLRQAQALPNSQSQPRIQQNLALVVGLQGRFDEARKIASEDLPQDQIDANMDYLQKMLSQPNTWQQLSNKG